MTGAIATPDTGAADGTQALAAPSIPLAAGTGVVANGVGMKNQPAALSIDVPEKTQVTQVLLYWSGLHFGAPDDTITVNGTSVQGTPIGGPTGFSPGPGEILATAYRADITGLDAVKPGANSLSLEDMSFDLATDGASVVVVHDDGGPKAGISMLDGVDTAWLHYQDPVLKATVPKVLAVAPGVVPRDGELTVHAADVGEDRPNIVRVTFPGHAPLEFVNPLGDTDGANWDTVTLPVTIPANVGSALVEVQSFDDGSGRSPASFSLVNLTLLAANPCSVPTELAAADGNAFGIKAKLLGGTVANIGPEPHTDLENPNHLTNLAIGGVSAKLLFVRNDIEDNDWDAEDDALAVANGLRVKLPGLDLSAETVVARALSSANGSSAFSSSAGSRVQNLVINGKTYPDIESTLTIPIVQGGTKVGQVHVLETLTSGAAKGVPQPEGSAPSLHFKSGLDVNGLRIELFDIAQTTKDEATEIIVAHADSVARAPSLEACNPGPAVAGEAFILDAGTTPPTADVRLGQVALPSTGGQDEANVLNLHPGLDGTGVGKSRTSGDLSPVVKSTASVAEADLASGKITAKLVQATADSDPAGATGKTLIASLVVNGTDVCATLALGATCEPPPNTTKTIGGLVLLILNEQLVDPANPERMTVNAVRLIALGPGNPLGLPVGAEVIISSAMADAVA